MCPEELRPGVFTVTESRLPVSSGCGEGGRNGRPLLRDYKISACVSEEHENGADGYTIRRLAHLTMLKTVLCDVCSTEFVLLDLPHLPSSSVLFALEVERSSIWPSVPFHPILPVPERLSSVCLLSPRSRGPGPSGFRAVGPVGDFLASLRWMLSWLHSCSFLADSSSQSCFPFCESHDVCSPPTTSPEQTLRDIPSFLVRSFYSVVTTQ